MAAEQTKRFGPYEIDAVVGAGGMGIVYRARDSRLGRVVAVKVLLPDIAANADAVSRFEREARAVAALSHPNILTIHDFGVHEGSAYAVMEFLDGPTLRVMLERGPIGVRRAVAIGVQIARGLAAAHDGNFIHRDLKPENVGLTRSGEVKILDFGLARQPVTRTLGTMDETNGQWNSRAGVVLGTVGYMSPEQVRGDELDYRSDLFSFGAVFYEMLTNRRPFGRPTAAESMTAILNDDPPDLYQSGTKVPPALERVIRRCLEKHANDRFHSARDLAFALENALHTSSELPAVPRRARKLIVPAALVAGGLALGAVAMAAWPRPAVTPMSVMVVTSSGADTEPAASPAGDQVAYASSRGGESTLWIRDLETGGRRAFSERDLQIPGGHRPRFFADGKRLLYLGSDETGAQSAFEVPVNASGERGELLIRDVFDAEPSPDNSGNIAFVRLGVDTSGRRFAVLGEYNVTTKATQALLTEQDVDLTSVRWAPDGQRVAVIRRSSLSGTDNSIVIVDRRTRAVLTIKPEGRGLFGALAWNGDGRSVIATESPDAQVFVPGAAGRILMIDVASGAQHILFKQGNLFGLFGSADANATIDVAGDGGLVFSTIEIHQNLRECAISGAGCVDASGPLRKGAGTTGYANDRQPAYSPDGEYVIFSSNRSGDLDLWVQSTKDGSVARLTQDKENDWDPAFTSDGGILWSSNRNTGNLEIWIAEFDRTRLGTANREVLLHSRKVSADGKDAENPTMTKGREWVVYSSANTDQPGIWKVRPDGRDATPLVKGPLFYIPDVSADSRYAAYLATDLVRSRNTIHVVEIATGRDTGFEIVLPYRGEASGDVTWGRARWMPDGQWLVFIGQDETGRAVVYKQRFTPGADTSATRERIVASLPGAMTESLAISSDGKFVTVSDGYYVRRLVRAESVPGVVGRGSVR